MFEKHDFMFKFDLKSDYYHVDVYPEHQNTLGMKVCYFRIVTHSDARKWLQDNGQSMKPSRAPHGGNFMQYR